MLSPSLLHKLFQRKTWHFKENVLVEFGLWPTILNLKVLLFLFKKKGTSWIFFTRHKSMTYGPWRCSSVVCEFVSFNNDDMRYSLSSLNAYLGFCLSCVRINLSRAEFLCWFLIHFPHFRWSLGAIMYEMLVGYPPFYADDPIMTCRKVNFLSWFTFMVCLVNGI